MKMQLNWRVDYSQNYCVILLPKNEEKCIFWFESLGNPNAVIIFTDVDLIQ